MSQEYNIKPVAQQETLSLEITKTLADGTPVDLTGYTPTGQIRSIADNSLILSFTFDVTDIATGKIIAELSKAQTSATETQTYKYDIFIDGATTERLLYGTIPIDDAVTQGV